VKFEDTLWEALTDSYNGMPMAITATSACLARHVAADRYDFQLIEVLRPAERLAQLQRKAAATADSTELGALAAEAEEVISIENEGWMAKLAEDPAEQKAS